MTISITEKARADKKIIAAASPFHPSFVAGARKLNGKYMGKPSDEWHFDSRDLDAVKDLCVKVYGTTGSDGVELVDVQYKFYDSDKTHYAYGREIAYRPGRDSRVKLGDGVIIVDGKFSPSAGSVANPRLMGSNDNEVTVEIRDVPIILVDDRCTIVRRPSMDVPVAPPRPFEGLSDEELHDMIAALVIEQAIRNPPQPTTH